MDGDGSVFWRCGCRHRAGPCPRGGRRGHGSWYFSLNVPDPGGGQVRRVRRGGYRSHSAAARALAAVRHPYTDGGRAALTVGGWLREWIETRHHLAPSTLKSYREHIQLHLEPGLGLIPLTELDVHDLVVFYQGLAKRRRTRDRAALSSATIQRVNTTLRAALNAARKQGLIDRNAASEIALPRGRRPRAVVWTDDLIAQWRRTGTHPPVAVWIATQTARFLASCREHRLYAAYHLIALRGLRRGETIGLRWCDLDLDQGIGYICRQRVRLREQVLETPPKTETSIRLLILDRTTVAVLRHHRARQLAFCAATSSEPSGYVFTDLRGQPLHPEYLYYALKKLTKAADLPPIRLHDLRHTAASLALEAGADLKVVSDQLGHSSIVLTADTYISVLPPLALKAAEATAKLIAKAGRRAPGSKKPRRSAAPARVRIRPPRSAAGATPPVATPSGSPASGATSSALTTTAPPARSRAERQATGKAVTAA
jgi:integrase